MAREKEIDKEMKEKVHLFIAGELDEEEQKEIFDWISSEKQNRKYYDGLRAALMATDFYVAKRKYDIQQAQSRLNKRIELVDEEKKTDFRMLFRIAASFLILLSTYIIFQSIRDSKSDQSQAISYNTIESPFGSRTKIYLPDSSYVVLNAGSTLRYPVDFQGMDNRKVYLRGEGYFEVRENKHSTFIVSVGDIDITALGTTFNVKAYPEEALIEATLVEGLLKINQGDNQQGAVFLRPNEKLSIIKGEDGILREPVGPGSEVKVETDLLKIPVREVNIEKMIDPVEEISWKDREWVIRGKTMKELSVMLERRYNVEIVLGDEEVGDFRFSGTLKDETLEQVLFAIRSTAPIDYKVDGRMILFTIDSILQKNYESLLNAKSNP